MGILIKRALLNSLGSILGPLIWEAPIWGNIGIYEIQCVLAMGPKDHINIRILMFTWSFGPLTGVLAAGLESDGQALHLADS